VKDILETRLVKRGVAVKALDYQKVEPAAMGTVRATREDPAGHRIGEGEGDREGDQGPEAEGAGRDPGDQVRVTGRAKDDLQEVMALLRAGDFGVPLQFTNYR
jgi:uncharacterized protein YajQ (UPF0234 family)